MHILPGNLPDYLTFRHGLRKIAEVSTLHEDSKTVIKHQSKVKHHSGLYTCILNIISPSLSLWQVFFEQIVLFFEHDQTLALTCTGSEFQEAGPNTENNLFPKVFQEWQNN